MMTCKQKFFPAPSTFFCWYFKQCLESPNFKARAAVQQNVHTSQQASMFSIGLCNK